MRCSPRLSLGPILFPIYVNKLKDASKCLDCIMFADDTNFFYSNKNIKCVFYIVNLELKKMRQWFKGNKLSTNIRKTKFGLFYKNSFKDDIAVPVNFLF